MKWGVRKNRRSGSKASQTSNSSAPKRNRKETAKKVAKAAAVTAGVAGTAYLTAKHGSRMKSTAASALKDKAFDHQQKAAKKALSKRNIGLEMRNSLASDIMAAKIRYDSDQYARKNPYAFQEFNDMIINGIYPHQRKKKRTIEDVFGLPNA